MTPPFWEGRRVFLTGHTGFKGAWLSLWLQRLGAEVVGFSLPPPTEPSIFALAKVDLGMRSVLGDVREAHAFSAAMREAGPEVVIHMAAQSLVRHSYSDPVGTYSTNVMGTVNLLEAVRQTPSVRAVVNVTTDKCYENREWVWGYRESDPMGGFDPYSSSKGCSELVTAAYRNSYFPPTTYESHRVAVATARAGNVVGGGDWAKDRLVPDILQAFAVGHPAVIRNPGAIRPWQHVLEPLSGYLTLAEHLCTGGMAFAEGWNFGPSAEDARSVGWIARELAAKWGAGAEWQTTDAEQPHEANYLKLDISKASARLGWLPSLRISQALDLTVEWAQAYLRGANVRDWTLTQIDRYQEAAV